MQASSRFFHVHPPWTLTVRFSLSMQTTFLILEDMSRRIPELVGMHPPRPQDALPLGVTAIPYS